MKLYYAPGACSLAPHIIALEAGLPLALDKFDFASGKTEAGTDFLSVNPKRQVPTLELDDGARLTEGSAIMQYLADLKPGSELLPKLGSMARYRVLEWLGFINSEVHKQFSPLFMPGSSDAAKADARANITKKLGFIETHLAGKTYVAGDHFTIADAYTFVVLNWTNFVGIDLQPYPNIQAFMKRIGERPKVKDALKAEGLAA